MNLVEQLEDSKLAEAAEAKREYRAIVVREVEGKTKPTDAALLAELLRTMGRSTSDFSRDARAIRDHQQAIANKKGAEGDPEKAQIEFDQAKKALDEARERFEHAKIELLAAQTRFDKAWSRPQRIELYEDGVRRAAETCRQLGILD